MNFSTLTLLFSSIVAAAWSDDVPVLIWSSDRSTDTLPPAYAGHRLSGSDFARDYLDKIFDVNSNRNIAIFIEDELSIEHIRDDAIDVSDGDFVYYASLKNAMDSSSIVLPAVTSAVDQLFSSIAETWSGPIYRLPNPSYNLHVPVIASTDDDSSDIPSLFVINMPKSQQIDNSSSDSIVDLITSQLEKLGRPFTGLYTSQRSSKSSPVMNSDHIGTSRKLSGRRRLLQQEIIDDGTYMFINISNCLYFYVENMTFTMGTNSWQLPLNPNVSESSYCANYSASLIMDFNVAPTLPVLTMTMIFTQTLGVNAGYWYMSNFSVFYHFVNGSNSVSDQVDIFPYFITETPFGLSYSCSYLPQIPTLNLTQTGRGINITFQQLQVQAFNISNNQFGYYNDCVGFFNIEIWCILFVLFILFIILADGMCMMMSLQTGDRTDDPRGKTITINEAE